MSDPQIKSSSNKSNQYVSSFSSNQNSSSQQLIIQNKDAVVTLKDNLINISEIFEMIKNYSHNKNKHLKYPYIVYNKNNRDVFATESSSEEKKKIIPANKNNVKKNTVKKNVKKFFKEKKGKKINRKLSHNLINDKNGKKIEEMLLEETDNKKYSQKRKSCFLIKLKTKKNGENKQKSNHQININSDNNNMNENGNKKIEQNKDLSYNNIFMEFMSSNIIRSNLKDTNSIGNQNQINNIENTEDKKENNDINNNENIKETNKENNNDNVHSNNNNENVTDDINNLNNLNTLKKKLNINRKLLLSAKMNKNKSKNQTNPKKMDLMLKKINYQRSLSNKFYNENNLNKKKNYGNNSNYNNKNYNYKYNNKNYKYSYNNKTNRSNNNDYNNNRTFKSNNNDYNYNNRTFKSNNNDYNHITYKSNSNDYNEYNKSKISEVNRRKSLKNKNFFKFTKIYKPEIKTRFIKKSKSTNKLKFPVINSILDDIDGLCKSILSNKKPEKLKNYGIKYIPYNKHFGYEYWKENEIRKNLITPKTAKTRFENCFDINLNDKNSNSNIYFSAYNPYSLNWTKKIMESDYNNKKFSLFNEDRIIRKFSSLTRGKSELSYQNLIKK